MPTNIVSKAGSEAPSGLRYAFFELWRSDDLTPVLLWTATGLAISLGFAAVGLQPNAAQTLLMMG